jgi:hypothetical protein
MHGAMSCECVRMGGQVRTAEGLCLGTRWADGGFLRVRNMQRCGDLREGRLMWQKARILIINNDSYRHVQGREAWVKQGSYAAKDLSG